MMLRNVQRGKIRRDPFTERLGIQNEIDEDGACITTHRCSEDECNIYGVVHGALLFAMADVGMGMALAAALPGEPRLGSISVTANFMNAGKPGLITAKSRVLRRGKAVAFLETEIFDGEGAPCARFSGVFHIYSDEGGRTP
ncbi:MAG: PaaI family thioesterase [Parvularculaceae bacterium]